MGESFKPKFVFFMGTTASGKSQLALNLALKYKAAIVNCDSLQVYRGLDIGTAKPTLQEMQMVPHYLFSYVEYPNTITAGEYTRDFYQLLKETSHSIYFVVGGTGFYFQALEKGMYPVRAANTELKSQIEKELLNPQAAQALWLELTAQDPEYARKIHPSDHYRLGRAIELIRTEKKNITQIQSEFAQKKSEFPYEYLKIGCQLSRDELSSRVLSRTEMMIKAGLVDETNALLERGCQAWSPLASIGYREVLQYLKELRSEEWLKEQIHQSTMQLAKKQRTWFRRDPQIHWYHPVDEIHLVQQEIQKFLHI